MQHSFCRISGEINLINKVLFFTQTNDEIKKFREVRLSCCETSFKVKKSCRIKKENISAIKSGSTINLELNLLKSKLFEILLSSSLCSTST
jgi:hypothetical protein